jgi:hypothetical protein
MRYGAVCDHRNSPMLVLYWVPCMEFICKSCRDVKDWLEFKGRRVS